MTMDEDYEAARERVAARQRARDFVNQGFAEMESQLEALIEKYGEDVTIDDVLRDQSG